MAGKTIQVANSAVNIFRIMLKHMHLARICIMHHIIQGLNIIRMIINKLAKY